MNHAHCVKFGRNISTKLQAEMNTEATEKFKEKMVVSMFILLTLER